MNDLVGVELPLKEEGDLRQVSQLKLPKIIFKLLLLKNNICSILKKLSVGYWTDSNIQGGCSKVHSLHRSGFFILRHF